MRDIISSGIEVHSKLAPGLLVRTYEEDLAVDLISNGESFERTQRGDMKLLCSINYINKFSVLSVVYSS